MIPSEREQELVAMFDSFCKTVIRNYSRTLIRRKSNRPENLDEPIEVKIDLTGLNEIAFDVLISYDLNDGIGKVEKTESYIYDILTGTLKPANSSTDPEPNPSDDEKSGCKKDASMIIVSLISLSSLLVLVKNHLGSTR